jgi:hypothetical protein
VVTKTGTVYQLGKPDPNALAAAFAINREFSYLVLVLCCIPLVDPGTPPAIAPRVRQAGSATLVVAVAASSRDGGLSSIQ